MAECEVAELTNSSPKIHCASAEVKGEEFDENSVMNEQEEKPGVDCFEEYPPLLGQGLLVCSSKSVVEHGLTTTTTWVDALKKPCLLVKAKVNENNLDISTVSPQESVAAPASDACSAISHELGVESTKAATLLIAAPRFIKRRNDEHGVDEATSARDLVKLKRKEIDSHLFVIRKLKTALTDLDSQEVLEAEKHLQTLKKELDTLKADVLNAGNHDKEKKVEEVPQHQEKVDVKSNAISIVQRFGALDGCSLSPDEKPHVLSRHVVSAVNSDEVELKGQGLEANDSTPQISTHELIQENAQLEAQVKKKKKKKNKKRLRKKQKNKIVATNQEMLWRTLIIIICLVFILFWLRYMDFIYYS